MPQCDCFSDYTAIPVRSFSIQVSISILFLESCVEPACCWGWCYMPLYVCWFPEKAGLQDTSADELLKGKDTNPWTFVFYWVYYGPTVAKVTCTLSKDPDHFLHTSLLELLLKALRGLSAHTSSCPRHCPRKELCQCLLSAFAVHLSVDSKSQPLHFKSTSSSLVPSASSKQEQLVPHPLSHNPENPRDPSLNHNSSNIATPLSFRECSSIKQAFNLKSRGSQPFSKP